MVHHSGRSKNPKTQSELPISEGDLDSAGTVELSFRPHRKRAQQRHQNRDARCGTVRYTTEGSGADERRIMSKDSTWSKLSPSLVRELLIETSHNGNQQANRWLKFSFSLVSGSKSTPRNWLQEIVDTTSRRPNGLTVTGYTRATSKSRGRRTDLSKLNRWALTESKPMLRESRGQSQICISGDCTEVAASIRVVAASSAYERPRHHIGVIPQRS
ncbi:hypothetical protein H4582DRAFT_2056120 [Lactarius indigo]|nr:hypothetical protein H4582DRAFT_2056120 [Lactarius indigo]